MVVIEVLLDTRSLRPSASVHASIRLDHDCSARFGQPERRTHDSVGTVTLVFGLGGASSARARGHTAPCTIRNAFDQPMSHDHTPRNHVLPVLLHSAVLHTSTNRYLLLMAFAALLVAAPLVRCQDDEDDAEEVPVHTEAASSPEAAEGGAGYADVATEYLNTATELGKQYVGQAAEVAQEYLGQYGVSVSVCWGCMRAGVGVPVSKCRL